MINLFKKKFTICLITVIVVIILVGSLVIIVGKNTNKALDNISKKSIASSAENNANKPSQNDINKVDNIQENNTNKSTENNINNSANNNNTNAATNTTNSSASQSNKSDTANNTGKTPNANSSNTSQQPAASAQQSNPQQQPKKSQPAPQNPMQKPASVSPQKYIYNDLGFSITFPASWKGKYTLRKNEDGLNVYFYSANHPEEAGVGRLFTIVKKTPHIDESMMDSISGAQRYITANGITYVIGGPTDVAFPPDNPDYSLYKQLASERSSVINSIQGVK